MSVPGHQPAVSAAALTPALAEALPAELGASAPALAALLAGMAAGRIRPDAATARLAADPDLRAALRALSGRDIATAQTLVSFGSDNQFGDIAIGDVVAGDKITVSLAMPISRLSIAEQRNRRAMLIKLRTEWVERLLGDTFSALGRADLGLAAVPEVVARPLAAAVQELGAPAARVPPRMTVAGAFDASGESLLVLGAPGAGKTVLLTELARALIERAEADESLPIPLILPLSSWAARRPPLRAWIVDELRAKYDVPRPVAEAWRDADALALLLDGLDEVDEPWREACVAAINSYRVASFAPIVVTSRGDEYRAARARLRLGLAIELQPLNAHGVEAVLAGVGAAAPAVRALLATDPDLSALAASPLMLAVIARAVPASLPAGAAPAPCSGCGRPLRPGARFCPGCATPVQHSREALRAGLVAAYVDKAFARRDATLRLPRERLERGLAYIAGQLRTGGQVIFQLEDLQPTWLPTAAARRAYTWIDRAGGALLINLLCLVVIVPLSLAVGANIRPTDPWVLYTSIAAIYGGTSLAGTDRPWRQMARDVLRGAIVGLLVGLPFGAAGYLLDAQRRELVALSQLDPRLGIIISAVVSGFTGMLGGTLYGVLTGPPGLRPRRVAVVERVRWSWRAGLVSVPVMVGVGAGVGAGAGILLSAALVATSLFAKVDVQGLGGPLGMSLLTIMLVVAATMVTFSVTIGAAFGLIGGLMAGLRAGVVTPLLAPGAGLRRSARSAALGGLFFAVAGALGILALLLLLVLIAGAIDLSGLDLLRSTLYGMALFALQLGVVGALCFGGYTVLSHLALRLILWRGGQLPWDLGALLAEGAERALLRRVGGGYSFPHRIFLEHFASFVVKKSDRR